jgi:branched-chain amino acid transport system permease protein/neutral amino acid transport system permease protein
MVTIAISLMVQFSLEAIQGPYILAYSASTHATMDIGGVVLSSGQLTTIIVAVLAMLAVHLLLRSTRSASRCGRPRPTPRSPAAAGLPGADEVVAWLVSGALCGLCGVLLGLGEGSFSATTGSDFSSRRGGGGAGGISQPYGAMLER